MKRTSLTRRTPLARGSKPLRVKGRDRVAPAEVTENFKVTVCSEPCIGEQIPGHVCIGPLQAMHVVPAQTLRKRGLRHLLYDPTNGVAGCLRIHTRHDNKVELIPRSLLPARCVEWARTHNVLDALERHWPEFNRGR